ncbi:MAG: aldo/keto reductase [Bryobacteraceae bacterium]|nr:aldo/keto reductase [Bryobacteraceae bacterium]
MKNRSTRRNFLRVAAAGAAAAGAKPALPTPGAVPEYRRGGMVYRQLGETGMWPSLLSFGSHTDPADRIQVREGKTVLTAKGQARRDRIIDRAFDLGVNLLDVYDSEGQWEPAAALVKSRRDKVLISLAHEISAVEIDRACRLFGHVDLYRFHTAEIDQAALENWDILRKAKGAGKVRAIGIATHIESTMSKALEELDGLDYVFFPYNFIHARADYSEFLPAAARKGTGLIAMKPLASGSIMKLDPKARAGMKPEFEPLQLWQRTNKAILPAAVVELTRSLDRMPDETLCMAAMRFVYSRRFLSTAIAGMFDDVLLEDNYKALTRYRESSPEERAALDAAREVARLCGSNWLPADYRWLEEQWRS